MAEAPIKYPRFVWLMPMLAIALTLVAEWITTYIENQRTVLETNQLLANYRAQLEQSLHYNLSLLSGIRTYVEVFPSLDQQDFEHFASRLIRDNPQIINVGAAKDLVISHIYPVQGNEAALGFAYHSNPKQWRSVQETIERDSLVLAGPLNLVQGGVGLIGREPVYWNASNKDERTLWGLISIVIDFEQLMHDLDYLENEDTQIALRGRHGKGAQGEVFYGDASVFDASDTVSAIIQLPYGEWQIAARPTQGYAIIRLHPFILFSAAIFLLMGFVLRWRSWLFEEERRVYNEHLQIEKRRADQANEAKSAFLANMSHEIRTPLNGIIGLTHLLGKHTTTKIQNDYLSKIILSAKTLLHVINDILDFSKIEANQLVIEQKEFSLNEVIENLCNITGALASQKQLEFVVDIPLELSGWYLGDSIRLQQVLLNLCTNAIKFTEKGQVRLSLTRVEQNGQAYLQFAVQDSGIGIEEHKQKLIFDAFRQADDSTTRQYGGTGLGLAICKRIVEQMGGEIWIESQIGQGSTFTFRMPSLPTQQQGTLVNALQNWRILLLEDEATTRDIMQEILEQQGAEMTCCASLKEAELAVQQQTFDAVIVDVRLPDGCGLKLFNVIRDLPSPQDPVMVICTAYDSSILCEQSERQKIHYIRKPFSALQLVSSLLSEQATEPVTMVEKTDIPLNVLKGVKVLLVEDNVINQEIASALLNDMGAEFALADNGEEAVEAVLQYDFDIVLMDVQMPVMDGVTATQYIRKYYNAAQLPIIAMTAHVLKEEIERFKAAGMNGHIGKPIDIQEMQQKIQTCLQHNSTPA